MTFDIEVFVVTVAILIAVTTPFSAAMYVRGLPYRLWPWQRKRAEELLVDAEAMLLSGELREADDAIDWWEEQVGAASVGWILKLNVISRLYDAAWMAYCNRNGFEYSPLRL